MVTQGHPGHDSNNREPHLVNHRISRATFALLMWVDGCPVAATTTESLVRWSTASHIQHSRSSSILKSMPKLDDYNFEPHVVECSMSHPVSADVLLMRGEERQGVMKVLAQSPRRQQRVSPIPPAEKNTKLIRQAFSPVITDFRLPVFQLLAPN